MFGKGRIGVFIVCRWIPVVSTIWVFVRHSLNLLHAWCVPNNTTPYDFKKKKKKNTARIDRLHHFYFPHFLNITAFGKNFPNQNTNSSRSLPHIPTMPDNGQSTPPLVLPPVAEYVLPALANTVSSVLELPSLHPLSQFLGTANTHDFATTEIDTIALLLASSRQNKHLHGLLDTLHQKVHAIGLQNNTLTQQLAALST